MIKSLKFKSVSLLLVLIAFSCSDQSALDSAQMQELELRKALGIGTDLPSEETRQRIQGTTEPRHFENIDDARYFINSVSKEFKISFDAKQIQRQIKKNGLVNKSGNVTIVLEDGSLLSVPCGSNFLDPFDGCDDGGNGGGQGCGSGSMVLTSSNQSIAYYFNAIFNFSSDNDGNVTASDFNSFTTGFTMGTTYNHISSNHSVSSNGTINFTITGTLDYNVFVDGVGTVWTDPVTMVGSFNPCSGNTGTLELFLVPAGGNN